MTLIDEIIHSIHLDTSADLEVGAFGTEVRCTSCDREVAELKDIHLPEGRWSVTEAVEWAATAIENARDEHQKDECPHIDMDEREDP